MIASMGAFAVADTLVKLSTSFMSTAQVMFYLLGGGLVIFALMAMVQKDRLMDRRALSPVLLIRYFAEIAGMVGMVTALASVPISVVGAITQATPILAAVGAVLFLNEKVGWRRWCSIIVGFIGVLLIVQPGATEFDYAVLWAILALFALSIRDVTTRLVPPDMASASLATYTMIASTPFAIGWVLYNGESLLPAGINWFVTLPMILLGALGYMLLIASIRIAEVSVVLPFRYSRIIASGTYMMWRERIMKEKT